MILTDNAGYVSAAALLFAYEIMQYFGAQRLVEGVGGGIAALDRQAKENQLQLRMLQGKGGVS